MRRQISSGMPQWLVVDVGDGGAVFRSTAYKTVLHCSHTGELHAIHDGNASVRWCAEDAGMWACVMRAALTILAVFGAILPKPSPARIAASLRPPHDKSPVQFGR